MTTPLLSVQNLNVEFTTPDGPVHAVQSLNFDMQAGETLGIVGESGSGKSQTVLAVMGLLADNGRATGSAVFDGADMLALSAEQIRRIRGARIAMIFQDPMTSLNSYMTVGQQMSLVLQFHQGLKRREARARCVDILNAVHITEAERRLDMYPHELSGGMRQRVMIASALLCEPALLIADEPTTALDVTVQAQILDLLRELREKFATSIILITHDLGVVAGTCDRILVMQSGQARDYGTVDQVFYSPTSAYTRGLLAAVPRLDEAPGLPARATGPEALLQVDALQVRFRVPSPKLFGRGQDLRAVDKVSFELGPGETLGVVGESGCGKSTVARAVLRLIEDTEGGVCLLGQDLTTLDRKDLHDARRHMQIIFQDPLASLNPRMTVRDIVAEPLETYRDDLTRLEVTQRVRRMLARVGLEEAHLNRYPHEFSGGQCQRIGIARALILEPRLVICDEPVSALDVSVQSRIVELLISLQKDLGLSLIFIAHDLAVVRQISHRVMVMYLGRIVEMSAQQQLYENPRHPYTRVLINAVPVPDPRVERNRVKARLEGDVPSPLDPPSGCSFRTRCPHAGDRCVRETPALRPLSGALVACHKAEQI